MLRGCNLTIREHVMELSWLIRKFSAVGAAINVYKPCLDKKLLSNDGWGLLSHQHLLNCLAWD